MKKCFLSLRLRTLPLSAAGVILGNFLLEEKCNFSIIVFILSLATALLLQIVSNLANELGDYRHGLDNKDRQGPAYALQQGLISYKALRNLVIFFVILSAILGFALVCYSMECIFSSVTLTFLIVGGLAILAALTYTLGKKPYGYRAFGDLSVFIFFGLLAVLGSNYLQNLHFLPKMLLPASAIGFLSVAVLNLNNIRDLDNDKACGKLTIALKLGERNAKIYHALLVVLAELFLVVYGCYEALFLLPVYIYHIVSVFRLSGRDLDKQFPLLSFSTLLLAILCGLVEFFCK